MHARITASLSRAAQRRRKHFKQHLDKNSKNQCKRNPQRRGLVRRIYSMIQANSGVYMQCGWPYVLLSEIYQNSRNGLQQQQCERQKGGEGARGLKVRRSCCRWKENNFLSSARCRGMLCFCVFPGRYSSLRSMLPSLAAPSPWSSHLLSVPGVCWELNKIERETCAWHTCTSAVVTSIPFYFISSYGRNYTQHISWARVNQIANLHLFSWHENNS